MKLPKKRCAHCAKVFQPTQKHAEYCSVNCRVKAWRSKRVYVLKSERQ